VRGCEGIVQLTNPSVMKMNIEDFNVMAMVEIESLIILACHFYTAETAVLPGLLIFYFIHIFPHDRADPDVGAGLCVFDKLNELVIEKEVIRATGGKVVKLAG